MNYLDDVIATLLAVPAQLEHYAHGLSEEQLSWRPSPDVFSVRENILHLRDIDIEGYERRIRMILTEDNPTLPDVDGGKLARERNYNLQPVAPAIEDLRRSRKASLETLANCSDSDLDRVAEMQGIGRIDLRHLLQLWIQHDAEHMADLRELHRAIVTGLPGNHLPNRGLRANGAAFRLL